MAPDHPLRAQRAPPAQMDAPSRSRAPSVLPASGGRCTLRPMRRPGPGPARTRPGPAPHIADPRPSARADGEAGALVLHGLTGTPYEVRAFAEALADQGMVVRVPALAGHHDLATLEKSTWREWYAGAEEALVELRRGCPR